jgi:hypothetical protein
VVDGLVKAGQLEGELCKQGEYIRRLGVDHNLEGMVGKEGPVSVWRRVRGRIRGGSLRKLAKGRRKGVNLYRASVMGSSMYGGEVSRWSNSELERERKKAAGHTGFRGMGVHSSLALFADDVSVDPGYRAAKDAITRVAKEIWLRCIVEGSKREKMSGDQWQELEGMFRSQGDLLSISEVGSLLKETHRLGVEEKRQKKTHNRAQAWPGSSVGKCGGVCGLDLQGNRRGRQRPPSLFHLGQQERD